MSEEQIRTFVPNIPAPRRSIEDMMVAFVQGYEPVQDLRPALAMQVRTCSGKCGRTVAIDVALCVRCRNMSQHPAFGRG